MCLIVENSPLDLLTNTDTGGIGKDIGMEIRVGKYTDG